jgi:hypothetical protein
MRNNYWRWCYTFISVPIIGGGSAWTTSTTPSIGARSAPTVRSNMTTTTRRSCGPGNNGSRAG